MEREGRVALPFAHGRAPRVSGASLAALLSSHLRTLASSTSRSVFESAGGAADFVAVPRRFGATIQASASSTMHAAAAIQLHGITSGFQAGNTAEAALAGARAGSGDGL